MNNDFIRGTTIALGMFDGVHAGHKALLRKAVEIAEQTNTVSLAYTFDNHPISVLFPDTKAVKLLLDNKKRFEYIQSLGIKKIVADCFDESLCTLSQSDFAKMLSERFNVKNIVAGFNYSFGKGGKGNINSLRELGKELGFSVTELSPVIIDGEIVSSSRIRNCVQNGRITEANSLLSCPYELFGEIIKNKQIGRKIGFPTANLMFSEKRLLPKFGVYLTKMVLDGVTYFGITNVGNNPTFGEDNSVTVETFILNTGFGDNNFYGKNATLQFLDFIREQKKFDSPKLLQKQIAKDVALARNQIDNIVNTINKIHKESFKN